MCLDIATPSGGNFEALMISSVLNITDTLRHSSRQDGKPYVYGLATQHRPTVHVICHPSHSLQLSSRSFVPWPPGWGTDPECSWARCSRSRPPDSTSATRS